MTSMTSSNIIAGFEVTGIFPFNRDVFKNEVKPSENSMEKQTGLSYIPLSVTPTKRRGSINQGHYRSFSVTSEDEGVNQLSDSSLTDTSLTVSEEESERVMHLPMRSDISQLLLIKPPEVSKDLCRRKPVF